MAHRFIFGLLAAATLAGCGSGTAINATNDATGVTPASNTATPISIQGQPPGSVSVGSSYSFQPVASDAGGNPLTYAIVNCPPWASFSTATGKFSGAPTAAQVGVYANIGISVSNGTTSAELPAFSITVTAGAADTPSLGGTPPVSVVAGNAYRFTPTTTDPSGGTLTFSIQNAPSWAAFNTVTGELSGTPTAADVGTYTNIAISASDGTASASLPSFTIAVTQSASGSATLQWAAPTENTNGTPLTNLAGYTIYYGTSAGALTQTVQIANPGILTYVISNLSPGTWYFEVSADNSANVQSSGSTMASKTIN